MMLMAQVKLIMMKLIQIHIINFLIILVFNDLHSKVRTISYAKDEK